MTAHLETHTKKYRNRRGEQGNVLFYILIAVVLVAALSYAVSDGMRGGGGHVSEERAKLMATEIIEYSNILKNAASQLKLRGCSDIEISFENDGSNPYIDAHTNANAPGDGSCNVFDLNGGGVRISPPPDEAIETANLGSINRIFLNSGYNLVGVGSDQADLVVQFNYLKEEVCTAINDLLGISNPGGAPPVEANGGSATTFHGNYASSPPADTLNDDIADLYGQTAFCRDNTTAFQFNKVLIAR